MRDIAAFLARAVVDEVRDLVDFVVCVCMYMYKSMHMQHVCCAVLCCAGCAVLGVNWARRTSIHQHTTTMEKKTTDPSPLLSLGPVDRRPRGSHCGAGEALAQPRPYGGAVSDGRG